VRQSIGEARTRWLKSTTATPSTSGHSCARPLVTVEADVDVYLPRSGRPGPLVPIWLALELLEGDVANEEDAAENLEVE
jgi:hypothetical protein